MWNHGWFVVLAEWWFAGMSLKEQLTDTSSKCCLVAITMLSINECNRDNNDQTIQETNMVLRVTSWV